MPAASAALGRPISYTPGALAESTSLKPPDDQVPSVPVASVNVVKPLDAPCVR